MRLYLFVYGMLVFEYTFWDIMDDNQKWDAFCSPVYTVI